MSKLALIKSFATAPLVDLYRSLLETEFKSVVTVSSFEDKKFKNPIIPIVVCETRADLKRCGVMCPYEFIFSRLDLLLWYNHNSASIIKGCEQVVKRVRLLLKLYPKGIDKEALQDWFAGAFRRYIFLDETVHGTSGCIDLDAVMNNTIISSIVSGSTEDEDANRLRQRFDIPIDNNRRT